MKILVTGCSGQLGFDVCRELTKRKIDYYGAVRKDFDLIDGKAAAAFVAAYAPDAVIHCAAYTDVDRAEDEVNVCRKINVDAARVMARVCKTIGAKMIYVSTDYVFDGIGGEFYPVNGLKAPLNVYGQSKSDGEEAVRGSLNECFIVRTSWVFGINGNNFVRTMLRLAESHDVLKVVDDQVGSPTYTVDLAVLLCDMVMSDKYGIYHATNEGICSWAEYAREIFRQTKISVQVVGQSAVSYPTKAKRPLNSRLSKKSLEDAGFTRLPDWHDALQRYIQELRDKGSV